MKVNLYSPKLKTPGAFTLPKFFEGKVNTDLLAQAIHVYRDRSHAGNSKVKTRAEVALTKAKWFKQKGTGHARHGAQSAPIFVGGGVTHGPKGIKRVLELPKRMKRRALESSFIAKANEGNVVVVSDLSVIKKTKEAQALVDSIISSDKVKVNKVTFAVSPKNIKVYTYLKNLENVSFERFGDLNAFKVYFSGKLVIDADNFEKEKVKTKKETK